MSSTQRKNNHWYILGAGAIGTLWASKLLAQDFACTLLLASKYTKTHSPAFPQWLNVTHLDQQQSQYPVSFEVINREQAQDKIDKLIVCTKSYQTLEAIKSIQDRLSDDAVIVLLQNGMGQHEQICTAFPRQLIIGATTTQGALLLALGSVKHTGDGDSYFGPWDTRQQIPAQICQQLMAIGMQYHSDIQQVLWNKLTINCVINPLTAIFNCKNGDLLAPEHAQLLRQLCAEIDSTAKSIGFDQAQPSLHRALQVAKATCENYSSMQQDIAHNRRTELHFINGYLEQKASENKIATPINRQIIKDVNKLESAGKKAGEK